MSAHTPGPWEERPIDSTAIQVRAGGAVVAEVATASYYTRLSAEQVANARLIAAAPETAAERDRLRGINAELLFKLISAANYIKNLGGDDKPYLGSINKAKGGAA